MQSSAKTPEQYIAELPVERREIIEKLRNTIKTHLPAGFEEVIQYGMISYVVPHSLYPAGYHCKPSDPLPFMSLASQKNHIALYHMGLYGDGKLLDWFTSEYSKAGKGPLNMGKSCIRWKHSLHIPYGLVGQLAEKITPQAWIEFYERSWKR